MAEVYEEPLPVTVVPSGSATGQKTLFDDPLPVVIVGGDTGGGGGSTELPSRLAEQATAFSGALTDINESGWYYMSGVDTPAATNRTVFVLAIIGLNAGPRHLYVYDIDARKVWTRSRLINGTSWSSWTPLQDADGAVDAIARNDLRYGTWTRSQDVYVGNSWGEEVWGARILRIDLSFNTGTMEPLPDSNSDVGFTLDVIVKQKTDGEPGTFEWPSNVIWTDGAVPPFTQTLGGIDRFQLLWTGQEWLGSKVGDYYLAE